jgi:hypothetical protein
MDTSMIDRYHFSPCKHNVQVDYKKDDIQIKCNMYLGRHKACSSKQCPANLNTHYKNRQRPNRIPADRYPTPAKEEKKREGKSVQSKDIRQSGK